MNDSTVFRLEDLPVEILIKIFQYLWAHELYLSFSHLNIRLNSILKSLPNVILLTASHWDPALSFFKSVRAVQIHFNHLTSSYLSQFDFSHFVGIRSFLICSSIPWNYYIEPIEQIDKFICPNLRPQLQYLWLPYCSQRLADWIFIGEFPHLKICHFYDMTYSTIVLPSWTSNTSQALRQLTIQRHHGYDFEKILLLCPNLSYFDFFCDDVFPSFVHLKSPYSSLKRLRLSRLQSFLFHNGQFDSLLSFFPNLRQFDLTINQCPVHNEIINFAQIAQYLRHRLPHLIILELRIFMTRRNRTVVFKDTFKKITQMHLLFKCFGITGTLLHIASFDFTSIYNYSYNFVGPSST